MNDPNPAESASFWASLGSPMLATSSTAKNTPGTCRRYRVLVAARLPSWCIRSQISRNSGAATEELPSRKIMYSVLRDAANSPASTGRTAGPHTMSRSSGTASQPSDRSRVIRIELAALVSA